jgi:type I restriction enzyme, S subunit
MSFPSYGQYKDSGAELLGKVPEHWTVQPNKALLSPRVDPVGKDANDYELLSLTLRGIVPRDVESGKGKFPAEFDTYQKVFPGDLVFCLFDMDETPRTVGLSSIRGMVTGAYSVFQCQPGVIPGFIYYYYLHLDAFKGLRPFYTGLRKVVRPSTFMAIRTPVPDKAEQRAIVEFIERETAKMDALVEEQQRLIELLKEKRQAVISHAVTKGLNPNAPMKDSGIEWLGRVPAHWEVCAIKRIADLRSGETINGEQIEDSGEFPVYGGNGLRGYTSRFTHDGSYALIGRQGALCGNVNYARGKFWASEHAVVVTPLGRSETFWLGELLRAMNLNQYSVSAAQPGLAVESIRNLRLPVPSHEEQVAIADFVGRETQKIDSLVNEHHRLIELLKERRQAVISAAVTGKIDVRQAVLEPVA